MSFILYSYFFDLVISILIILNYILTSIAATKKQEDTSLDVNNKIDKLEAFKTIVIVLSLGILAIIFGLFLKKYNMDYLFVILWFLLPPFLQLTKIYKKNLIDLSTENKNSYIQATYIFLLFFSSSSTQVYLNIPFTISHTIKEYLLLAFLSLKIIFFVFCLIINISIFASNIYIIFKKPLIKIKDLFNKIINKEFDLSFYNFYLSKKLSKKLFILDALIYIILCPFTIIIYTIFAIIMLIMKLIFRCCLKLGSKLINYFNNSSKIISKVIKISTIISLLIVYIIATYNSNIISYTTKETYTLFITVILIPLIYDSIKSK